MARDGAIASPRRGAECAARFSAAPNVFEKSEANTSIIKANKKEEESRMDANRSKSKSVRIGRFRRKENIIHVRRKRFSPRRGLAQTRMNAVLFFCKLPRIDPKEFGFKPRSRPRIRLGSSSDLSFPRCKTPDISCKTPDTRVSGVLHPATMPIAIFSKRLGGAFSVRTGVRTFSDFFRTFSDRSCARSRLTGSENARSLEKCPVGREDAHAVARLPFAQRRARTEDSGVRSAWRKHARRGRASCDPRDPAPPRASRGVGCYRFARFHRRRRRARLVVSRGARVRVDVVAAWRARRTAPRVPRRSRVAESRRARAARDRGRGRATPEQGVAPA